MAHGSVLMHFGSKEKLFLAAVPGPRDLDELVDGDPATLPERIAHGFVSHMEAPDADDPLVAVIRAAATNQQAAVNLYAAMHERSIAAYSKVFDVPDALPRLELMASLLIGATFKRYILRYGPLAAMSPVELEGHLARAIRGILSD